MIVRKFVLLLALAVIALLGAQPARGASFTWFQQAQQGDSDYFSEAGVGTFHDDPFVTNFIPYGDCSTYAPFSQPGYDTDGCYGGYATPTTQWGTFCIDYSAGTPSTADCQPQLHDASGPDRFAKQVGEFSGTDTGCTQFCGAHVLYRFMDNYDRAFEPPGFSGPPAYPVIFLNSTQASLSSVGANFHAYLCLDLTDTSLPGSFLEICEETWRPDGGTGGGSGFNCDAPIWVSFTPSHPTSPYMTNWGDDEALYNDHSWHNFGFSINPNQLQQIVADQNAKCNYGLSSNVNNYAIVMTEDGIEGGSVPGGATAGEINDQTYLRTNW